MGFGLSGVAAGRGVSLCAALWWCCWCPLGLCPSPVLLVAFSRARSLLGLFPLVAPPAHAARPSRSSGGADPKGEVLPKIASRLCPAYATQKWTGQRQEERSEKRLLAVLK